MVFLKKRLVFLVLILAVYAAYFLTHGTSSPTKPQVLGVTAHLALFEQPQDGRQPILTALQQAKKEILVEVYLLSDAQVLQALEAAEIRGVLVKVMIEQHPFGSSNNARTFKILQQENIPVEWTNEAFALTHEKAIIIDGAEAFILNQNLTAAAFSKNREYDIEDTNQADVAEIRNMFIADWERKTFAPQDPSLLISPITSRGALTALIGSAKKGIELEVEDIEDNRLVSLLSQKAAVLPVEIIVPTLTQISSNKQALQTLTKAGAQVKMVSSPYIHAKLLLVDGEKAYVGSVNFSSQSLDENRELGILISQQDIVQELSQDFTTDWQHN